MTTDRPLTVSDAVDLATIVDWCIHNRRLAWVDDRGDISRGTARSIGDERGNFLARNTGDVRDAFVRITTDAGWDWFVPVVDILARIRVGTIVADAR